MTAALARSSYRKADSASAQVVDNPHQVISVTLRELKRSLDVLSYHVENKKPCPEMHLNRAFTAVYILQSSLDFEKGGELALNLFQAYEFVRIQLVRAFRREKDADLSTSVEAIDGITEAWMEIAPQVAAQTQNSQASEGNTS